MRILFATDIHLCHLDFCNLDPRQRMEYFVNNIIKEYNDNPFEALILLGDYSLDHWVWSIKGSYIEQGLSNTEIFAKEYLSRIEAALPDVKIMMLAGNHEQYGEELWEKITGGYSRKDHLFINNWLFIGFDTFAGDLDPTEHSDGTYTDIDPEYALEIINKYPDANVVLCGHYFKWNDCTDEFKSIITLPNVRFAVCGHNHRFDFVIPDDVNEKRIFFAGDYSYTGEMPDSPFRPTWGYREFIIEDDHVISGYIMPETTVGENHYPREYYSQTSIDIK